MHLRIVDVRKVVESGIEKYVVVCRVNQLAEIWHIIAAVSAEAAVAEAVTRTAESTPVTPCIESVCGVK